MADTERPSTTVVVTGSGAVSSFGEDVDAQFEALLRGEPAFSPLELPHTPDADLLRVEVGASVDFNPRERFAGRNARPVDRTGRLALMAAEGALAAADWTEEARAEHLVGLALGTLFGSVGTIAAFDRRGLEAGPKYVKPLDFANSVINAAAGQTAIWHQLRGVSSTVAGGPSAALQAIGQARDLLRAGRADAMLAGGAEELCFEGVYGFQQAGWTANGNPPNSRPFDRNSEGLVPAEGACLLALETADRAAARGVRPLAAVLGHGSAFDPSRGKREERTAAALDRAVNVALEDAGLSADDLDVVFAGASGRPDADRAEALGLAAVASRRSGDRPLPVTATKSVLGESFGAAGAFQALALVQAMHAGRVPAIRGLQHPSADLDFCREVRDLEIRAGLVTALGPDGNVAALALGKV